MLTWKPLSLRGQMGFSVGAAQCLVTPPWVFAGVVMGIEAWLCDKKKVRGPIIIFNCVMVLIGLPIMGFHPKSGVRYFGVFLVTGFINGNIPAALAWQSNNIVGQWKRAFTAATLVTFGGIGGIAGATVFRSQDAPAYRPGMYAAITSAVLTIITTLLLEVKIYFENKRQAKGEVLEGTVSGSTSKSSVRCLLTHDPARFPQYHLKGWRNALRTFVSPCWENVEPSGWPGVDTATKGSSQDEYHGAGFGFSTASSLACLRPQG